MSETCLNKEPIYKGAVFHKIVERRLDSAAGGALCAIIETFLKDNGYYCAPVYDEVFHLNYILTNDPNRITDVIDECMTDCALGDCLQQIKQLLEKKERVLFAGLPCHCKELSSFLGTENSNLIVVEMLCTGVSENMLLDKYIEEKEKKQGAKIESVHFRDKEFPYSNSKRISFKNGVTEYYYDREAFDTLHERKVFLNDRCNDCPYCGKEGKLGDLSIGVYGHGYQLGDNLGYSIVYIYSEKGLDLFNQAKRRLEIYNEGETVKDAFVERGCSRSNVMPVSELNFLSLRECYVKLWGEQKNILHKLKQYIRVCKMELKISRFHISPIIKFIRINFLRKNTKTCIDKLAYVFIAPYCEFDLAKNAVIELHGPLYVGTEKRVPSSRIETRIWMRANSKLIVHKQCIFAFGGDVEIFKDAVLEVGDLVTANPFTIICGERIEIGTPVNIAKNTEVRDTNSHLLSTNGYKLNRPITIGNHVWIASNCAVMPGTKIGDGCVISGVSYVNKKIPSFSIADGHPAEVKSSIKYFRM